MSDTHTIPATSSDKIMITGSAEANLAAQWQSQNYINKVQSEMLKDEILRRIIEATELAKQVKNERTEESPIQIMDWDRLYEVSSNIMDSFTKEMDETINQLNQLYKKYLLWQEAAFTIDSHRGATRFGKAETWMRAKEANLEYKRKELNQSARVIIDTLKNLAKS